ILSGLVVTFITRYLFSRKDNREYTQKVVTANQEILYAVRPGISEGVIPTEDVLSSLISATAIKYGVDMNNLHNTKSFADVLIKEVMDSSFIAASTKADFCQKLSQLRPTAEPMQSTARTVRSSSELSDYRQRMVTMLSVMMGITVSLTTVVLSLNKFRTNLDTDTFSKNVILVPTLVATLVVTGVTYSMWMVRFLERKMKDKQHRSSVIVNDFKKIINKTIKDEN
ncbi:MAG: hypothetical protein K9M75_00675, partial [Phycisphaerae bacterium]|nr:hypothetical protein [Phycisphaerae bacterium]